MKNLVLLFTFLALTSVVKAQKDTSRFSNWSFEVFYSPNVSYRILAGSESEKWHRENRNSSEITRLGHSRKILAVRRLKGGWSFGTGLTSSRIGFKTKATALVWITPDPNYATEIRSTSEYSYIGIPILAYYKLGENNRWSTELIFGTSINLYNGKTVISEIKTNDVWISYPNNGYTYSFFNLFGHIGIGTSYSLTRHWLLKTNLNLNQSFTSTNNLSDTKEYLNFLAIDIGVNYTIRR
ncbi:MAG: hypothetical protein IIA45_00740 [Bacteroidetes bacterium]|nr:hypothetical protein [Bacteroidota bacterium]